MGSQEVEYTTTVVYLVCSHSNILNIVVHIELLVWTYQATTLKIVLSGGIALCPGVLHVSFWLSFVMLEGQQYGYCTTINCYPMLVNFELSSMAETLVLSYQRNVFSRHGIPEVVRSNNGPQYSSREFATFAEEYSFKHVTSSPLYLQSNGQAEWTVQTMKKILRQSEDIYKGLLMYCSTPMPWCVLSPV